MCKICSFHGLARNIETDLYFFPVSGRSKNPTTYMKHSSLRQHLMVSSHHHCAIAYYSHFSLEIFGICTRVHPQTSVENIKEIQLGYNCCMKIVDLESTSACILSYLWLNNRSLENLWTLSDMLNFLIRNFSENFKCYAMFASCAFLIKEF